MKSVLMSIHPKWCEKIFNGEKTVEIRKTFPQQLVTPFKVYVYCTYGKSLLEKAHPEERCVLCYYEGAKIEWNISGSLNGKVIGEFTCTAINPFDTLSAIFDKVFTRYLLNISCLSFEELKEYSGEKYSKDLYGWCIKEPILYDKPKELSDFGLKRPPQSWCYVKERE